jgi:hypothetical protein
LKFNRSFEKYEPRENGVMRFDMLLLKRFFGKLVHDILPAALASVLGGFLITHFQLNRVAAPVTVPVAHASPEMMQLLRDEHGLIVDFVKAQVESEKNAGDSKQQVVNTKERAANMDGGAPRLAMTSRPAIIAAPPAVSRPATILALAPAKPPAPRTKPPVAGASLPPVAAASMQPSESPSVAARNDDSLLAKTIGIKDRVVGATQRAVGAVTEIPSWFGSIGDRFGGDNPSPRPPADLVSEL